MQRKSNRRPLIDDPRIAERSIVLALLSDEHPQQWSPAELRGELFDVEPDAVTEALQSLEKGGVMERSGESVSASQCARHLGSLGMVCI